MAGGVAPEGNGAVVPDPVDAAREEFLRQLLEAAERGVLGPEDYAERVRALESTASVADMVAVVTRPAGAGSGAMGNPGPADPSAPRTEPDLDPVDLARLMAPPSTSRRRERSRYGALIALVVLFFLLLVAGLFLVSHVHAGGGTVGAPAFGLGFGHGPLGGAPG